MWSALVERSLSCPVSPVQYVHLFMYTNKVSLYKSTTDQLLKHKILCKYKNQTWKDVSYSSDQYTAIC